MLIVYKKATELARMFYPAQAPNKERFFIPRMNDGGFQIRFSVKGKSI